MNETVNKLSTAPVSPAAAGGAQPLPAYFGSDAQYLSFQLAGQDYGIQILCVQEIRAWEQPTRLPQAPEYVEGVINLRGAVVPILDLRRRFGLSDAERPRSPVVIVLSSVTTRGAVTLGIVVDAVCEVCAIQAHSIQPPPQVSAGVDSELVRGLATVGAQLLILLDADRLMSQAVAQPTTAPAAAA